MKPKWLPAGWEGVVAFICRRRVWCARVDAVGSKQALCFQLSVWEVKPHLPRIPCHTLPHSPHGGSTRPHQTVHQQPNCRFHPLWHQNEKKKNLFSHVLLILLHDRRCADACQSCGGGALPFHTQLAGCLASVLRQYLSFSVWQKQSHWFLILIPFFSYWSPIHP